MVCCTTKNADTVSGVEKADQDSLTKQVVTDTVYLVESNDEDFIKFIKIFHTDTVFQKQRVAEVVHGYNSDEDPFLYFHDQTDDENSSDDYIWDKSKIASYLRMSDYLVADTASEYKRYIVIRSDTVIDEEFAIPGSGTYSVYTFKKKDGKWFFTDLSYNCL